MYPELFEIPLINYPVKSWGFMMMIGFLAAVYLAAKRAERVRVDPDAVINAAFFALVGGVVGARLFYVIHYWQRDFANRPHPLIEAVVGMTKGGMEFLGGVIGAFVLIVVYLVYKGKSIRLYLDILTPGLMLGLAFGRIGCFLNGCCWGGVCGQNVSQHWAVQFPFGSPAHIRQFQERQLALPASLLKVGDDLGWVTYVMDRQQVDLEPERMRHYARKLAGAKEVFEIYSKSDPGSTEERKAKKEVEKLEALAAEERQQYRFVSGTLRNYPSLEFEGQHMTPSELTSLAKSYRSLAVHPSQLYASINGLVASLFLAMVFRIRKRHGMVFAVWLLTYPWTRFVLELIRVDNPKDSFGLTISQFLVVTMVLAGVVMMLILYRLPERSPAAVAWQPPSPEQPEKR